MPDRIFRADAWSSEAVNALHDRTFRLYVALINCADDFGLLEASFGAIKAAAPLTSWTRQEVAMMLGELTDAGLILPYEDAGRPLAAIARWRSRVSSVRPKHPAPPWGMGHLLKPSGFKDEATRKATSNYFKHLDHETGEHQGTTSGGPGNEGVGVGLGEGGLDTSHSVATGVVRKSRTSAPPCPTERLIEGWNTICAPAGCVKLKVPTKARAAIIAAAWRKVFDDGAVQTAPEALKLFHGFFKRVAASKFLTGRAPPISGHSKPYRADLGTMMSPEKFARLVEGKYDD